MPYTRPISVHWRSTYSPLNQAGKCSTNQIFWSVPRGKALPPFKQTKTEVIVSIKSKGKEGCKGGEISAFLTFVPFSRVTKKRSRTFSVSYETQTSKKQPSLENLTAKPECCSKLMWKLLSKLKATLVNWVTMQFQVKMWPKCKTHYELLGVYAQVLDGVKSLFSESHAPELKAYPVCWAPWEIHLNLHTASLSGDRMSVLFTLE